MRIYRARLAGVLRLPAAAGLLMALLMPVTALADQRWVVDRVTGIDGERVVAAFSADPSLQNLLFYLCAPNSEALMIQGPHLWLQDDKPERADVLLQVDGRSLSPLDFQTVDYDAFRSVIAQRGDGPEAFDELLAALAEPDASLTVTIEGTALAYPPGVGQAIAQAQATCRL